MTWAIEADIELGPANGGGMVHAFVGFFAADVEYVQIEITRGDWPVGRLGEHEVGAEDLDTLTELVCVQQAPDRTVVVRPVLREAGAFDYRPEPEIYLFGADLKATG